MPGALLASGLPLAGSGRSQCAVYTPCRCARGPPTLDVVVSNHLLNPTFHPIMRLRCPACFPRHRCLHRGRHRGGGQQRGQGAHRGVHPLRAGGRVPQRAGGGAKRGAEGWDQGAVHGGCCMGCTRRASGACSRCMGRRAAAELAPHRGRSSRQLTPPRTTRAGPGIRRGGAACTRG